MAKKKLKKFAENDTFPNLFQPNYHNLLEKGFHLKGKWHSEFFKNDNPIILELACGKGEYTVGLAKLHPENNYIGIDRQGARLWRGCKTSNEEKMSNVAFLRTHIQYLPQLFGENEISEIWITFPDPQPKKERKRLTSNNMIDRYVQVLKPDGIMHLKTDSEFFYDFTLEVIEENNHNILTQTRDLYSEMPQSEVASIQTYYESIWLEMGKKIHYLKYKLNPKLFQK